MTHEEFVSKVWKEITNCPKEWRKGQAVFNVIDSMYYPVARQVQFEDGVDCFYDDSKIDLVLDLAWVRIKSKEVQ